MKTIVMQDIGLNHLHLIHTPIPEIRPDQILVKMEFASLNYLDLLVIQGDLKLPIHYPYCPISDGSGTVIDVGTHVHDFKNGDRVATVFMPKWREGRFTPEKTALETRSGLGVVSGCLAEYRAFKKDQVIHIPDEISLKAASTLPIAGLTAWKALEHGKVYGGQTILLHGTGGTSIFALQFAKKMGLKVIITSSSEEKLERAQTLGADHLINYRTTPDWNKKILDVTCGQGVDFVFENVGGDNINKSIAALRTEGHISLVGLQTGFEMKINAIPLLWKNATIRGMEVGNYEDFHNMLKFLLINNIHPIIDKEFSLIETAAALRYLQSGNHFGKIAINISN